MILHNIGNLQWSYCSLAHSHWYVLQILSKGIPLVSNMNICAKTGSMCYSLVWIYARSSEDMVLTREYHIKILPFEDHIISSCCHRPKCLALCTLQFVEHKKIIVVFSIISQHWNRTWNYYWCRIFKGWFILQSIPWLRMTWIPASPGNQRAWYGTSFPRILCSQYQKHYQCKNVFKTITEHSVQ